MTLVQTSGNRGFSYVEVLISIVLIVMTLIPAMNALVPAIQGTTVHEEVVTEHYRLRAKFEEILAQPYDDLFNEAIALWDPTVPSALYSDPVATQNRRLVYLARIDADNADADDDPFTGTENDLLWIRVSIDGNFRALESVVSPYD
ncbi:MAG: hypothetical protein O7E57_10650 [Gammaproteobacteria bacterium]|nr:hypothetical protein [Gammaproteobacteria bacterium]MCZ6853899.1 hypothetical protein [Gammaproteobacteria bacterium]